MKVFRTGSCCAIGTYLQAEACTRKRVNKLVPQLAI